MNLERIVLATNNKSKVPELRRMLYPQIKNIQTISTFSLNVPEETGSTYEKNAKIKADHCFSVSGEASLADDSGIELAMLYGAPGVESARYAPTQEQRISKMLNVFARDPNMHSHLRRATQRCVLCFQDKHECVYFEGVVEGEISTEPRGKNGFGYDSIFLIPSLGKTLAELNEEEKDKISHRGNAIRKFLEYLKNK